MRCLDVHDYSRVLQEAEEGEFQLMPTSTATQSSDGASPPKKMPRGPLPRSVAWGVADDKLRKQRGKFFAAVHSV